MPASPASSTSRAGSAPATSAWSPPTHASRRFPLGSGSPSTTTAAAWSCSTKAPTTRSSPRTSPPSSCVAPSCSSRSTRPALTASAAATGARAGVVEALLTAARAEEDVHGHDSVELRAGRGVVGDRYFDGTGTFSASGKHGQQLTLIEAEVLDALHDDGLHLTPADARRNIVTRGIDLNALVGQEFQIGTARCIGRRLCEPCSHLQRLTGTALLRPLVHRGGLRADILTSGVVHVGYADRTLTGIRDGRRIEISPTITEAIAAGGLSLTQRDIAAGPDSSLRATLASCSDIASRPRPRSQRGRANRCLPLLGAGEE